MELIENALREKKIAYKDLSDELKSEIKALQRMMDSYNEICDEYEKEPDEDPKTEKVLDRMDHDIATVELKIADEIKGITTQSTGGKVAADGEKESSGIGWLIFGGVVLAITFGAVNVLKKK